MGWPSFVTAHGDHGHGLDASGDYNLRPARCFWEGHDRVEVWDADDFDPWDTLRWQTVRVLRYRQYKPDGTVYEAFWLTDFPTCGSAAALCFALPRAVGKSRTKHFKTAAWNAL